jgi:glycosyltransferase involved in cell wall biosynthesis
MSGPAVLFVAHAFPRHEHDLPGNFLLRLAVALADEGVRVVAVAPGGRGLRAYETLSGVEVHRYRYATRGAETLAYTGGMHTRAASGTGPAAMGGLLAAGSLAARRLGRDRVVHAHWWAPGGVQALASGRRPLVTTLHGTDVRLAARRPSARRLFARVLRASAVVTAVSGWLRDQAVALDPGLAERVVVAPMPVDEDMFAPGVRGDELLFVGRLDAQKGLQDALMALPGMAHERSLRVVGSGPDEAALRALAERLGVAARVTWEPYLPAAELALRYRQAAALVVPGRDEGLGLVAVEAQLSGTPVVAATSGGLLDVVADGDTGRTYPPGEPAALARVLDELLASDVGAMVERARRSALERFSRRAAARAYADVYAQARELQEHAKR